MSRVTAIISALIICIIVSLSWAVNHYRDNAIAYKVQRDKNARELKLANAAITDMQMRQRDVAALDAKYTKELADAKAENDALRDDVANNWKEPRSILMSSADRADHIDGQLMQLF